MDTKKCNKCNRTFPATPEFFFSKKHGRFGISALCKECDYLRKLDWNKKNNEKVNATCRKVQAKRKTKNPFYQRDYVRKKKLEIKLELFAGYGNKCACCGETTFEFLSLDHINGDGNLDRKRFGRSSYRTINMYREVIASGFPNSFQVLCFNCHFAKDFYGYCPHGNIKRTYDRTKQKDSSFDV